MSCGGLSYSEQFDELLLAPATPPLALQCLGRLPKPDPQACAADAGRAIPFSSVPAKPQVGKWVGPPSASDYVVRTTRYSALIAASMGGAAGLLLSVREPQCADRRASPPPPPTGSGCRA